MFFKNSLEEGSAPREWKITNVEGFVPVIYGECTKLLANLTHKHDLYTTEKDA